jgi:hypothetical protein
MPEIRRRPGTKSRATSTTSTLFPQSNAAAKADFDFDRHIVDRVDESIWAALFDGHFRLAVRCDVCGRWLTANTSKKADRGPRCAAKVVTS